MNVLRGDCVEVMAGMDADSIDAVVCDPPYGLEFMGKEWDRLGAGITKHEGTNAFEVQRKGSLPFGGSGKRVSYGANVKSMEAWHQQWATAALRVAKPGAYLLAFGGTRTVHRMTCALEDAGWVIRDMLVWAYAQGFPKSRASLKPAWEPIVLARKPGASRDLRIDECRIGTPDGFGGGAKASSGFADGYERGDGFTPSAVGRWPANLVLTDPILDGGWEGVVGGGETFGVSKGVRGRSTIPALRGFHDVTEVGQEVGYGDSGTYSRFFLIPKAPTRERVLSDGRRSPHPTQKPEALIRHLVNLVTPPDGLVLDPFLGSGTLGVVCEGLGVRWVGIEREPEYADWAEDRIADEAPAWSAA